MASISSSGLYPSDTVLTKKQSDLLEQLRCVTSAIGISVNVNPVGKTYEGPVSVDTEHNESGEFVGCGLYSGGSSIDYYSDLLHLLRVDFHSLDIIAHNGVSDIEMLQVWGIKVNYDQLHHDTMLLGHIIDSSQNVLNEL